MLAKIKDRLVIARDGIRENPYHALIGITLIGVGINMILEPVNFIWPPFLDGLADDHGFDAAFIFAGLMILYWTVSRSHHLEFDAAYLAVAGFLMATLSIYQMIHVSHTGIYMPWLQDTAITVLIIILARRSDGNADLE